MKKHNSTLDARSISLRRQIMSAVDISRRGHVASALSLVEIIRVLYDHVLRYRPKQPNWKNRDRFILSKGHGCLALYVLLAEKGFFPKSELARFCSFDGILGGHPQYGKVPGVEASTGSLGHGLAIGIGHALYAKRHNQSWRTFVVVSDGECNEGSTWEAALHATKHKLDNLIVLVDYNHMQSYSTTDEVLPLDPLNEKWKAFGFDVFEVDGHNTKDMLTTIRRCTPRGKPLCIICHTVKGKGVSFMEGNAFWHHKVNITDEEMKALLDDLDASVVSS